MADTDEKEKKENRTPEEIAADIAKAQADAAQAHAEALKALAEVKRIELDIRSAEIGLRSSELSLRQTEMSTRIAEIDLEVREQTRKETLAGDKYHHTYTFDAVVNESSVTQCIRQLATWDRTDPGCNIEIVFDSPGGSVIDGMHLFDYIQLMRQKGHKITTVAMGYAASMAGILLQAGDDRVMGREAYMLIHEVSTLAWGKATAIEDELKFIKKIQARILHIFTARSNVTRRYIERNWKRKDWWMDADEALKFGFCDRILTEGFGPPEPKRGRSKK